MKNLTRVLALVLVLAMMMSTVAFASFTDVAADDDYAEAIETLAALGIIKGYTDGTFGADKAITRAEAVAIVNRIQNLSLAASGAAGASLYTDVAADHWALGDINLATQMGVISGDGNGLFRPEDQVSYQEMVKMLTVALGYGPAVAENGGWPTGYLVVANSKGVLDDTVNAGATAANRGVVAQLTFNALTAPIMEQTGYGDEKEYHFIEAGSSAGINFTKTLLSEKLGIYKIDVVANASDTKTLGAGLAEVGKVDVNPFVAAAGAANIGNNDTYDVSVPQDLRVTTFVKGNSTLGEDLGYGAVAYVKKNADKKPEVLYSSIDQVVNKTVEINPKAIVEVDANGAIVVENEDGKKEKFFAYDANTGAQADVVRNNKQYEIVVGTPIVGSTLDEFHFTYTETSGATDYLDTPVTLLYNDNRDDIIDYIFIEEYTCDVVVDEAFDGTTVYLDQHQALDLDTKANKGLAYDMTLDGKAITPADLQVGDVVNYIETSAGNSTYYKILVSRNVVEGAVESFKTKSGVDYYTIAGEDYSIATGMSVALNQGASLGKTGAFHLDAFGKIAKFEKLAGAGAVADFNFGFVKAFAVDTGNLTSAAKMIIMDKTGETNTYTLANTITLNVNENRGGTIVEDSTPVSGVVPGTAIADSVASVVSGAVNPILATAIGNGDKTTLIDFTLNSDGKINSITVYPIGNANAVQSDDEFFRHSTASGNYVERNNKLGTSLNVTEDTIVFCIRQNNAAGTDDDDEYFVTDWSILEDGTNYSYTAYCVNEDNEIGALLINQNITTDSSKDAAAVFAGIASVKKADGTQSQLVSFYQNGELKEMYTTAGNTIAAGTLAVGEVFTYSVQKDEISGVTTLGTAVYTAAGQPFAAGRLGAANTFGGGDDLLAYQAPELVQGTAAYYAYGQVIDKTGNKVKLGGFTQGANHAYTDTANFETYTIPESANIYLVTNGRLEDTVEVGALTSFFKNRFFEDNSNKFLPVVDKADNYTVLIKFNKDMDITDVVAYKNFSTDNAAVAGTNPACATLVAQY